MTLYEHLVKLNEGEEVTVFDNEYDMEVYFYAPEKEIDSWDKDMLEFAKVLTVVKVSQYGVTVNITEVIQNHIAALKKAELFDNCTVGTIMYNMSSIISGYVGEAWFHEFVEVLKQKGE